MKSTMAYAAKRALFTALTAQAGPAQPLDGIEVAYSYPPNPSRKVIYGGGVRSTVTDAAGEWGVVGSEVIVIGVYIKVLRPDADVRTTDTDVEAIADTITAVMAADPDMGGAMTWMGVQSAMGDYAQTPDGPESVLSMQVLVGAVLV